MINTFIYQLLNQCGITLMNSPIGWLQHNAKDGGGVIVLQIQM